MIDFKRGARSLGLWTTALGCIQGLTVPSLAAGPSTDTLDAHYSVELLGLHVGDLYANGSVAPKSYHVGVTAHLSGLATMISNVKLALASNGAMRKGNLAPSAYATSSVNSNETRTLRMALNAGNVKAVEVMPPLEYHGERVPVTEANKRNVLDPTSALIMPVPVKDALVGPAACDRTLPIYDGYARFDITLEYIGTQTVQVDGYSGPVSVCHARYRPISGHLVNSRSTAYMAQNEGIEVWLAPIEHAHVVVPLRVTMPTMAGNVEIQATEFHVTEGDAAPTH